VRVLTFIICTTIFFKGGFSEGKKQYNIIRTNYQPRQDLAHLLTDYFHFFFWIWNYLQLSFSLLTSFIFTVSDQTQWMVNKTKSAQPKICLHVHQLEVKALREGLRNLEPLLGKPPSRLEEITLSWTIPRTTLTLFVTPFGVKEYRRESELAAMTPWSKFWVERTWFCSPFTVFDRWQWR
jgi:hypothetical protein